MQDHKGVYPVVETPDEKINVITTGKQDLVNTDERSQQLVQYCQCARNSAPLNY